MLVGFGGEGRANLAYVAAHGARSIAIADRSNDLVLSASESALVSDLYLGEQWLHALHDYDVIVRSPGVPPHALEQALRASPDCHVTSGTNIFLARHANKTIAITGTKGKSTTSSLVYSVLAASGIRTRFGGNIGVPALSLLEAPADLFVLELSSYQLEDCRTSPHGALFINLYPEHLDHHGNFTRYGEAKANITRFQTADDFAVLPFNSTLVHDLTAASSSRKILFGSKEGQSWIEDEHYYYRDSRGAPHKLFHTGDTRLKGPGNQQNILATLCVASHYDVPDEIITRTITEFSPLPHRLQEVGIVGGIMFINDSISTVPEATINALETFGSKVKTLILGGFDRGIGFEGLAKYLVTNSSVETILLFPPSGTRIEAAIRGALQSHDVTTRTYPRFISVNSMPEAIEAARQYTPCNSVCLLSPASPSFPLFKNFEERGEKFREQIMKLKANDASESQGR